MSVTGYSLINYGGMISNKPRMDAYVEALRRSVTPGCHVLDIGAGPGAFAVLACQFGAGSVVMIEPDASIELAKKIAFDNGVADRITFVRDLSTAYRPQRRADVVVSDIRGILPLFESHIPSIADMRERLLAPGGVQIPGVDRLFVSLVESPKIAKTLHNPWVENDYGLNLEAGRGYAFNSMMRTYHDSADMLLAEPQHCLTLDYHTITEPNHTMEAALTVTRRGTAHGLLVWFETELIPGVGYSNAPGQEELVYGQTFFPLESAMELDTGAQVNAKITARLVDGHYVFGWNVEAMDRHGTAHKLKQSSFKADFIDPTKLAVRSAGFRPPVTALHAADKWLLERFDGQTDLATLSRELAAHFPEEFPSESAAFERVAKVSAFYNT